MNRTYNTTQETLRFFKGRKNSNMNEFKEKYPDIKLYIKKQGNYASIDLSNDDYNTEQFNNACNYVEKLLNNSAQLVKEMKFQTKMKKDRIKRNRENKARNEIRKNFEERNKKEKEIYKDSMTKEEYDNYMEGLKTNPYYGLLLDN